ncbi:MAG: L,D-transpeptidase family protein [Alphaproteobacteria bacterium]|nr:L,D-transpeptidase family protein [Alphaproteobacteria bacterium]
MNAETAHLLGIGLCTGVFLLIGAGCTPSRAAPPTPAEIAAAPLPDGVDAARVDAVLPDGCFAAVEDLPTPDDPRLDGDAVIVIAKEARRLMLFSGGRLAEGPGCWPVALGVDRMGVYPPGPKQRMGDRRTPEGWYRSSDKPWSNFYGAIAVHYPNADDAARGIRQGLIGEAEASEIRAALDADRKPPQRTALGGEILVHGGGSSADWTWGCVALDNDELDALRAMLPEGMRTDILILP